MHVKMVMMSDYRPGIPQASVSGTFSFGLCDPDSVCCLMRDIFWPTKVAVRSFKELGENRFTQENKNAILLFPYPNTGMCLWRGMCVFVHAFFCCFPQFFLSPSVSISFFSTCSSLMSPPWFGDGSVSHDAPAPGSGGPVQGWRSFASSSACLFSSSLYRVYKEMRGITKKVKIKKASVPNNKKKYGIEKEKPQI